ncbi:universal stress protein [Erythrobacter insulae]|nr:universal stress protein [Erythrobacter insulae]
MNISPQGLRAIDDGPPPVSRHTARSAIEHRPHTPNRRPHILACVDDSPRADAVAYHALTVASSLGLEVTFARVIEQSGQSAVPADPIEWQLRWETQRSQLHDLEHRFDNGVKTAGVVLVGDPCDELIDWSEVNGATLLALSTGTRSETNGMGPTTMRVLQSGTTSLLLVPPQAQSSAHRYRRIMVPIDGSSRAESVLPIARRIARSHGAELLLVHTVPKAGASQGFQGKNVGTLHAEIERQNKQNAKSQLEQLTARVEDDGITVQSVLLGPADPRHATCQLSKDREVDLVVMSSHGATALSDIPCGSVAEYLATHCSMPVLMVRPNLVTDFGAGRFDTNGQSVFRFG